MRKSTFAEAASKPNGWVGDFNGMNIGIPDVSDMLTTKLWYTSNTTVQDGN